MTVIIVHTNDKYDKEFNADKGHTCFTCENWDEKSLQLSITGVKLFPSEDHEQESRPEEFPTLEQLLSEQSKDRNSLKQQEQSETRICGSNFDCGGILVRQSPATERYHGLFRNHCPNNSCISTISEARKPLPVKTNVRHNVKTLLLVAYGK